MVVPTTCHRRHRGSGSTWSSHLDRVADRRAPGTPWSPCPARSRRSPLGARPLVDDRRDDRSIPSTVARPASRRPRRRSCASVPTQPRGGDHTLVGAQHLERSGAPDGRRFDGGADATRPRARRSWRGVPEQAVEAGGQAGGAERRAERRTPARQGRARRQSAGAAPAERHAQARGGGRREVGRSARRPGRRRGRSAGPRPAELAGDGPPRGQGHDGGDADRPEASTSESTNGPGSISTTPAAPKGPIGDSTTQHRSPPRGDRPVTAPRASAASGLLPGHPEGPQRRAVVPLPPALADTAWPAKAAAASAVIAPNSMVPAAS